MAVGAGAAVMGAVGAGAYYLLGPKGKAHQKKALALAGKMKKEVEGQIKKAEKITTPLYHKTVDMVSENYAKQYKDHEQEIKAFAKVLKGEWKEVVKKAAPKAAKKVVKVSKKKSTK